VEQKAIDDLQLVSHGFKILLINDIEGAFFPLAALQMSQVHYESASSGQ